MKPSSTRARMLTIAGIGIATVVVIGGTATAASQITASQMATGSVNSRVVKDGAVHQRDLSSHAKALLHKGNTTTSSDLRSASGPVPTGGSFNANAVEVGTLTLDKGTYLVNVSAKATPDAARSIGVFPQFFVYNQPKNVNFDGNLFNVGSGSLAKDSTTLDSYYSGSQVITLDQATTLHVYAFGYDSDTSAGSYTLDGGTITATSLN